MGELIVVDLAAPLGSASSANHKNEVKQKEKGVVGFQEKKKKPKNSLASSGCGQQAFLLDVLLLGLRDGRRLLLLRRHLAGLVEDAEKDEHEDAHHGVADDGHDRPH